MELTLTICSLIPRDPEFCSKLGPYRVLLP
jgi:hypothetical protein